MGQKLRYGTMGESLILSGFDERSACMGGMHRLDEIILRAGRLRSPCVKISKVHQKSGFCAKVSESGLSGWYYKVLREGECFINTSLKII